MAGTPTSPPGGDSPAAERADEDGLAWERPVPARWAPSPEMTAQTVPANPEVMRTAPGEGPISR